MAAIPFTPHPLLSQLINDPDIIECIKTNLGSPCTHTAVEIDVYIAQAQSIIDALPTVPQGTFTKPNHFMRTLFKGFIQIMELHKCLIATNCGVLNDNIDKIALIINEALIITIVPLP